MESRVRDLEQLEEQDPEDRRRKLGNVLLAMFAIVGLTFAIGVVVGKAADPGAPERDPFDQLDRVAAAFEAAQPSAAGAAASARLEAPAVEASELTFQQRLTEDEERPEVIAALAAAAREEQKLAAPGSNDRAATAVALAPAQDPSEAIVPADDEPIAKLVVLDDEPEGSDAQTRAQGTVPAGLAAGSASGKLERARKHDQLIAAALPDAAPTPRARRGSDGEYTLQVISYDTKASAEAFASNLRARGHEAFVTAGDIPGRGRVFRVRIGPYKTKQRAEEYRREFEDKERMNTIVVKRKD